MVTTPKILIEMRGRVIMTPKYITRSILGAASLLLVQCVPSQDLNSLDLRIRNLDSRVVKLDQSFDKYEGHGQDNPIDQLQRNQAEMADLLDKLNNEILQLKGQLEENSHFYTQLDDENTEFKDMKITDLSEQILLFGLYLQHQF